MAAPIFNNLDNDTPTFTFGGTPVLLDVGSDVTVSDTDNPAHYAGGTLSVSVVGGTGDDWLGIDPSSGISINGNGVVTVDGVTIGQITTAITNTFIGVFNTDATPARIETLIQALTYYNTGSSATGNRSVSIALTQADGGSATATVDVALTPAAPTDIITIDPITSDNTIDAGETVTITGSVIPPATTGDTVTLNFNANGGGEFSYDTIVDVNGNFSFTDPLLTSNLLAEVDHTVEIVVTVTSTGQSFTAVHNYAVTSNQSPIFSTTEVTILENQNVAALLDNLVVDPQGDFLSYSIDTQSAGVGVDGDQFFINFFGEIVFTNAPDFENPVDGGGDNVYQVTVVATDPNGNSTSQIISVTVTNDPNEITNPVIANFDGDSVSYDIANPASPAVLFDQGTALTVSDADNPANVDGATLFVSVEYDSNGFGAQGVLEIPTSGSGIVREGTNIRAGGVAGTIIGNLNYYYGSSFDLTFNASATLQHVEQLLQVLAYSNNDVTATGNRSVTVAFDDGQFGNTSVTTYVTLTNSNAPTGQIVVDPITSNNDNILELTELSAQVSITGYVTGSFNASDEISLFVNGDYYFGNLDATGAFSVDVAGSSLAQDGDSIINASLVTTNAQNISAIYNLYSESPTIRKNIDEMR